MNVYLLENLFGISVQSNGSGCAARIGDRRAAMDKIKKRIKSFYNLDVYQGTYKAMLVVFKAEG